MSKFVSDTMAYILHLEKRKMPETVKKIFADAENGENEIIIPAMVVAEIGYLSEKKRIDTNLNEVKQHLNLSRNFTEQALNTDIIIT